MLTHLISACRTAPRVGRLLKGVCVGLSDLGGFLGVENEAMSK
jgi:hypothetical protein